MKFAYIQDLVVETGRRCEANCLHCLRGKPQDLRISQRAISAFCSGLAKGASVGTLSIGGGEPALALSELALLRRTLKRRGIPYGSFYLVSGGFVNEDRLRHLAVEALELWAGCEDKDLEMSGLALSDDLFHPYVRDSVRDLFSGLSFFRPEDKTVEQRRPQCLIREGRAKNLEDSPEEYVFRDLGPSDWSFDEIEKDEDGNLQIVGGNLYLCANGNIVNCCDLSYDHADGNPVCSVFDRNWPEIWYRETLRREKAGEPA